MSDRPCIVGVQSCGCITYVNARPDQLGRDDEKELARVVRAGGSIVRTTTEEARAMPHFLAAECPHDPRGWEKDPPAEDPWVKLRTRIIRSRDVRIVYSRSQPHLGEVRKWDGAWEATRGWFNYRTDGANDGRDPRGPADVLGPFPTLREAMESLA